MAQTIALVDDDRNILTGISIALEREGFKVQTYIDGESALIGLTRNPPDLAVLDIKMPRMDGEELLKKLRKKMSIPIIFLTSKDEEVDELLGLKLGADDYLTKPANIDDIEKSLMSATTSSLPPPPENPMSADRIRWEHIQRVFTQCNRNVSETARRLKMHRRTLQRILNKHAPKE